MAKKTMVVTFKIKDPGISEQAGTLLRDRIKQKLKATIKKEKIKEKKGEWTLKAKEPERVTIESLAYSVKKCELKKIIRELAIEE